MLKIRLRNATIRQRYVTETINEKRKIRYLKDTLKLCKSCVNSELWGTMILGTINWGTMTQ